MHYIDLKNIKSWAKNYTGSYRLYYPKNVNEIKSILSKKNKIIAAGGFRSYGDSAINDTILSSKFLNKILNFDEKNGILRAQAGTTIEQMINFLIPKGWFLNVSPGTKYATLGGCIASDVHGKEHHKFGCFSEGLNKIKLLLNENEIVEIDRSSNPDLFYSTCGGMGLTGFILEAEINCKKIQSSEIYFNKYLNQSLDSVFQCFEKYSDYDYSVAWLDTIKSNNNYKSVFTCGNFSNSFKKKLKLNKKKENQYSF